MVRGANQKLFNPDQKSISIIGFHGYVFHLICSSIIDNRTVEPLKGAITDFGRRHQGKKCFAASSAVMSAAD